MRFLRFPHSPSKIGTTVPPITRNLPVLGRSTGGLYVRRLHESFRKQLETAVRYVVAETATPYLGVFRYALPLGTNKECGYSIPESAATPNVKGKDGPSIFGCAARALS
jgi:hypothetical protein